MYPILTEAPAAAGGMGSMLLMLVIFFGIMYFMMIRPENKKKKEAEEMRNSVKVGDRITTIGGIVGVIVDVKPEKVVVETSADRVRIEFAKWAISTNDTATEAAQAEAKKKAEARTRAKKEQKEAKGKR